MNKQLDSKSLENGLTIYFYPDKSKHSVFIDLIVKYGAFYSDFVREGQAYHIKDGMAHLIEHLLFEKSKYGNMAKLFGNKQMQTNAITSTYMTEFYVDTVFDIDFALEHLIKGVSVPTFTSEDIEETKPPIYQEIRMRNDQVGRRIYKSQTKNMLTNYSYIDGLGSIGDVESFSYEQVKLCYDTFYQPKNEILFIAGNFDVEEVYEKIKEIYASLSFQDILFSIPTIEEPKEVKECYEVIMMPTPKDYISVCYKVDFSKYKMEERRMLTYYIGIFLEMHFSIISPLYKELIEKKIIDSSLSYDYDFFKEYMLISVCGYTNEEKLLVKRIREVFEKEHIFKEEIFNLDLKEEKMKHLCSDISLYGLSRQFITNYSYFHYENFNTAEDLNQLNFDNFKSFIESLKFKEYLVTKITDSK